ncbi:MAG: SOUL family heme-binding protein [Betaproteobacteria bacterium]
MKRRPLLLLLLAAPAAALLLIAGNAMALEEPAYTVEQTFDEFELRRYAPYLVVETAADSRNAAFRRLFNYIAGRNVAQQKIEMTVPVVMNPPGQGEKIEMTAPVVSQGETMQFVLPARFTLDTAPRPADAAVRLRAIEAQWLAVRRYSGTWSERNFAQNEAALRAAAQAAGLTATGPARFAAYNGPLTPWFMRRNEVLLPVAAPR